MEQRAELSIAVGFLVLLVVVGVGAYSLGASSGGMPRVPSLPAMPSSPDGLLHSVSGTVSAKTEGGITVNALLPGEKQPRDVAITIGSDTVIVLQKSKDPTAMEQEMREFQNQNAGSSAGPTAPPQPFTETDISSADLTVGMFVNVTPAEGTKEGARSIQAVRITTVSFNAPPAPPMPPPPPTVGL